MRAQELADWLETQSNIVGDVKKFTNVTSENFKNKTGIVFIKDGWGATDHIDVWDGKDMKGGTAGYFALGKEVWFWEIL